MSDSFLSEKVSAKSEELQLQHLSRVARRAPLEVQLPAEELEIHVLRPTLDQRLVALAVGELQL